MKICVVGGTGNISSSIVNLLLKKNHEIVCFNRGIRNILPSGVRLIKGDRSDTKNFEKIIQLENFDAAIDMVINGVKSASKNHKLPDHRTVIIHAQLMRKDQLVMVK